MAQKSDRAPRQQQKKRTLVTKTKSTSKKLKLSNGDAILNSSKRGKNVSFAEELTQDEDSRPVKSVADLSFSSVTKSILRKPKPANVTVEVPKEKENEMEITNNEVNYNAVKGERRKLTVKKSVKEKLMAMDRKERREFIRELRAQNKPEFAVVQEAKKVWEKLRSSKTPLNAKEDLAQKLWEMVRGTSKKLIFAHDTSRIFQSLLMFGNAKICDEMFDELIPELIRMCRSAYAYFFVMKMLKHKNKRYREVIMQSVRGHYVALFRSKLAAKIVEYIYNDVAGAAERFEIASEFYGKEYSLFKKEQHVKSIKEISEKHPEKIELIVKNLESALRGLVEGEQMKHSLTHYLLWNYFTYCNKVQKLEMIEAIKDRLPEIAHSREGAEVAMECIWNLNVKDRKAIVKSFGDCAVRSANDQFARRVLFAMFDSIDDTILLNRYITKEIADNIADVIYNKYGVSVLHYIVCPREPLVFGKTGLVDLLKRGDSNEFTKKPQSVRYKEIFDALKDSLYPFLAANMREILNNKISAVLVLNALEPSKDEDLMKREVDDQYLIDCFEAIAEMANDEYIPHIDDGTESTPHIMQAGAGRFVLKRLLRVDEQQPTIKLSDSIAKLPAEQLRYFLIQNSGCFDLVHMLRSGSSAARNAVIEAINMKTLEKKSSTFVGAGLLLEELKKK